MNKIIKSRLQEMLLDASRKMPIYPEPSVSDTTWIAEYVCKNHTQELIKMGVIDDVSDAFWKRHKFLRQLNNLHRDGRIRKKIEYGGAGMGHNYTLIRWGHHAR